MEPDKIEPEKIVFPCDYPVKVVARATLGLRERLDAAFATHFGQFEPHRVSQRDSAQQNFVSYTYLMHVKNIEQLGALHAELQDTPDVVMVI